MEKRTFKKGDFVKYRAYNDTSNKITFGIFEGNNLAPEYQYTKKLSLVLFYDSLRYMQSLDGSSWGYRAHLDVSTNTRDCEKTIDTYIEDSWWSICTDEEKTKALEILDSYGYSWDDETLTLTKKDTNELVRKIVVPKIEYDGSIIKPISDWLKSKLHKFVLSKIKYSSSSASPYGGYNPQYGYNGYGDYYDD